MPRIRRVAAVLLIAVLAAPELVQAAIGTPELPDPGSVPGVTKEQQEQVGLKTMSEVYRQMPVLPDSDPVSQYVRQLGRRLVAVIPERYSWPYQFHVLREKDINAFALPGGPIFINLGTIKAVDNEAELAGVMAHEMSHVYMQHSMKQQRQAALPSILGGLASVAGAIVGGPVGALGQVGGQIVAGSIIMKYSRADEAQADAVGAIIMYKAGYNPQAMADFFQKLERESGSGPPQFLSDHPNPGNRYAAITKEIQDWPPRQWRGNSTEFEQIKAAAGQMKAYSAQEIQQRAQSGGGWDNQRPEPVSSRSPGSGSDNESDSSTRSNAPSASAEPMASIPASVSGIFKTLRRPGYSLQYPENWQAVTGSHGGVTIAPAGGVWQDDISYGVMVNQFLPTNPNASLAEKMRELIRAIRRLNPEVRSVGSPQRVTVNGVGGQSVDLMGNSPVAGSNGRPLPERDWLVSLPRPDGKLLYVVFIAPDRDFGRLRPAFEKMLRSLRLE